MANMTVRKERLFTGEFVLCTVGAFLLTMVFFMFYTEMSSYAEDEFGADSSVGGLVASIFIVGDLIGRVSMGNAMRWIGFRRTAVCLSALLTVTAALYYVADSVLFVCAIRLVQGFCYGSVSSAFNTMAVMKVPASRRGEGLGYYMLNYSLASALGPLIAIYLGNDGDYDAIFAIGIIFAAVATLTALAMKEEAKVPRPPKHRPRLSDYLEPSAYRVSAVIFLYFFAYSGIITFAGSYGKEYGLEDYMTFYFAAMSVVTLFCRLFLGKTYDTRGANVAILPSLFMFSAGMLLMALKSGPAAILSAMLIGTMIAMLTGTSQAIITKDAEPSRYSQAIATYNVALDLSYAVGPTIIGEVADASGYADAYLYLGLLSLLFIAVYWVLVGSRESKRRKGAA
jgi:MFS family permease